MRKDFGAKPWTYPQPVFIVAAYDENGVANAMNAAWGGISCDEEICLCLSEGHKTTQNILAQKAFTVSMADETHMAACDYLGVVSGNKVADKVVHAGFTVSKSAFVNAPVLNELPMTLECEFLSYDKESCHLFGKIVNVSADENVLTDGKIDCEKLRPISFDPVSMQYRALGNVVGHAFRDGLVLR
jgi:Conserved protein/domain typically associated with flavoprotein oxygenases, DIM6/NTAB family